MKIGNLDFKAYAAKKPVSISPGGELISAEKIAEQPTLSLGSLFTLDPKLQKKLAMERYKLEPDFKLGIIGHGLLTKDDVVNELKNETEFGQVVLRAEMGYLNELIAQLPGWQPPEYKPVPERPLPPFPYWRWRKHYIWVRLTNRVLFCENTTDSVTTPFANYRIANVHPVFAARGFNLIVLKGANDVRANFIAPAKNILTVYISGIGHGNYDLYTGHWGDHILEVGKYDPAEVKDKSLHFLSCRTGRDLGPDTIKNGADSYAGYTENFTFVWDDGTTQNVDEFELFAHSDSSFDIEMANGATAKQAYNTAINAFNAAIAQVPNTVAATWLAYDRDHLKLHGDGSSKILPYRYVRIQVPTPRFELEDALINAGDLKDLPK